MVNDLQGHIELVRQPSRTYQWTPTITYGHVDGLDALKQSVEHILHTERYAYPIYPPDYGVELRQYMGAGYPYLEATIERTLKDALTQDDRVLGVTITQLSQGEKIDSAIVVFDVHTGLGLLKAEVRVVV